MKKAVSAPSDVNVDQVVFVSVDEAKSARRNIEKSQLIKELEVTLTKLPAGQAGKIEAKAEKAQTIRNRIVRVAKYMAMDNLRVKRAGDTIYFFKDKEK